MVAQPVEAVWVWNFGTANLKATYGRIRDDDSYSKDYLQVSGDCSRLMASVLSVDLATNDKEYKKLIKYSWPGGQADGFIKHSVDRLHLSWRTVDGAPAPWKMDTNPKAEGPATIPGDPSGVDAAEARSFFDEYKNSETNACLMAIKIHGDPDVLHIRAYIQDPEEALAFASTQHLPEVIRAVAAKAIRSNRCASILLEGGGSALTPEVENAIEMLQENPNLLLVGPPGTGKTVLLEQLTKYIEEPGHGIAFDPEKNHDAWSESTEMATPGKTRTVVLHPSYSYDNLVLGLMPVPNKDGGVAVKAVPGPLMSLAHYASGGNRAVLVLDEFNRGNAAAVLGDVLALLDKDKRGSAFIDLPYGDLDVHVPDEFAVSTETKVDSRFTLPPTLWIVAAMNSSDRSVAPLDAALRRRFSIVEMPPDYEALARNLDAGNEHDFEVDWVDWTVQTVASLAVELLRGMNDRIDAVLGQDFRLGHSNFWQLSGDSPTEMLHSVAVAFDRRVTQTLRLSLSDNDELLGAILLAGTSDNAVASNIEQVAWWKAGSPALGAFGSPRLHFNCLADLEAGRLHKELLRLAGV